MDRPPVVRLPAVRRLIGGVPLHDREAEPLRRPEPLNAAQAIGRVERTLNDPAQFDAPGRGLRNVPLPFRSAMPRRASRGLGRSRSA